MINTTAIDTHPDYRAEVVEEWRLMRDAYRGESAIKRQGKKYLRPLNGWGSRTDGGVSKYELFIFNARFPEIVANSIRAMVGIAHGQEWHIEMPAALEYLWENSDGKGFPLEAMSKRITTEILTTGRYTLLVDAPKGGGDIYLAGYTAEELVNWSEDNDFYVLREVVRVRNGMLWTDVIKTRELVIESGRYVQRVYDDGALSDTFYPSARGGAALTSIPIAIGGAMDVDLKQTPPR